jgi:protein TonB
MFDDVLIESAGKDKTEGRGLTAIISMVVHIVIIGAIIAAGYYVKKNPDVVVKPIRAFMVSAPPPPPPPPPPPGPSASSSTPTPKIETPKEQPQFHQPTEVPKEVPQVAETTTGAESGVTGGQEGGVVGGVVGGVAGGVVGGTLGGQLGGTLGGTGTALRVGGDVKAPVAITRIEPQYTELARKARIEGIVIIEAIIDRNGNVTDARILKPLPLGLDQSALDAVKRWKFSPGTLGGQPVPVIYNLTVNFRLQ